MKVKSIRIILLIILSVALFIVDVHAEEQEKLPDAIGREFESVLSGLPAALKEKLPSGLFSDEQSSVEDAVEEMLTPSFIWQALCDAVGLHFGDAVRLLVQVCGVLVLSSFFVAMRRALRTEASGRMVQIISSAAILTLVVGEQNLLFSDLREYFSSLSLLAGSMIPMMGALYAIGGNLGGAATGSAMMSIFLAVSELIGGKLLIPTVGICMAFSVVPVIAPTLNLRSLLSCIKRCFTFALGFMMMLLSALLAMRSGLAAKADSVGARTVKYVASSIIPVVGGSIADSLRTVGAGVEYLRTTLGVAGILLIVLLLLPFLVSVILMRLALILSASAAEMLGCDTEAKLLGELVGVYGYILAVSSMCAVMFIFALTILVRTASVIG